MENAIDRLDDYFVKSDPVTEDNAGDYVAKLINEVSILKLDNEDLRDTIEDLTDNSI